MGKPFTGHIFSIFFVVISSAIQGDGCILHIRGEIHSTIEEPGIFGSVSGYVAAVSAAADAAAASAAVAAAASAAAEAVRAAAVQEGDKLRNTML